MREAPASPRGGHDRRLVGGRVAAPLDRPRGASRACRTGRRGPGRCGVRPRSTPRTRATVSVQRRSADGAVGVLAHERERVVDRADVRARRPATTSAFFAVPPPSALAAVRRDLGRRDAPARRGPCVTATAIAGLRAVGGRRRRARRRRIRARRGSRARAGAGRRGRGRRAAPRRRRRRRRPPASPASGRGLASPVPRRARPASCLHLLRAAARPGRAAPPARPCSVVGGPAQLRAPRRGCARARPSPVTASIRRRFAPIDAFAHDLDRADEPERVHVRAAAELDRVLARLRAPARGRRTCRRRTRSRRCCSACSLVVS